MAVVRRRFGDREDRFFSTVFIGSATLYIAVWLVGASLLAAPAVTLSLQESGGISQEAVTLTIGSAAALILIVAPSLQAVFVIATSTLILRTSALPRWLSILGYLVGGALFVVPTLYRFLGIGLPIWVLVVSITILLVRRNPTALDTQQTIR